MKVDIVAKHIELTPKLKKYTNKKISKLDSILPRKQRENIHCEVILEETAKPATPFTCEAILSIPGNKIVVKESTVNIFAAVDIVEAKLKNRVRKYKSKNTNTTRRQKGIRGVLGNLRR